MTTLDPRLFWNDQERTRAHVIAGLAILPIAELARHAVDDPMGLAFGLAWLGATIADGLWEDVRGDAGAYVLALPMRRATLVATKIAHGLGAAALLGFGLQLLGWSGLVEAGVRALAGLVGGTADLRALPPAWDLALAPIAGQAVYLALAGLAPRRRGDARDLLLIAGAVGLFGMGFGLGHGAGHGVLVALVGSAVLVAWASRRLARLEVAG